MFSRNTYITVSQILWAIKNMTMKWYLDYLSSRALSMNAWKWHLKIINNLSMLWLTLSYLASNKEGSNRQKWLQKHLTERCAEAKRVNQTMNTVKDLIKYFPCIAILKTKTSSVLSTTVPLQNGYSHSVVHQMTLSVLYWRNLRIIMTQSLTWVIQCSET